MTRPPRIPSRRAGFTLVELLVVILILAILIALLVPAIAAAVKAANNARVAAEITNMQTALADFKNKNGEYPPSRIVLHNNCYYNPTDTTALNGTYDITLGDLNQRTVRAMKKYFPRAGAYFNTSSAGIGFDWDGSGNNMTSNQVLLQGHECLVFFLGGMPNIYTSPSSTLPPPAVTGFNKDPLNPFNVGGNRTVPLFEFVPSRLQDIFSIAYNGVGTNGFPSYADPLAPPSEPRPYAYFSAYGNNGYDPNDDDSAGVGNSVGGAVDSASLEDAGSLVARSFYVSFVTGAGAGGHVSTSTAPNPYTIGDASLPTATWVNPQSFQLLSAGIDAQWGIGGTYDATSTTNRLPVFGTSGEPANASTIRPRERDNITNFSGGKLD